MDFYLERWIEILVSLFYVNPNDINIGDIYLTEIFVIHKVGYYKELIYRNGLKLVDTEDTRYWDKCSALSWELSDNRLYSLRRVIFLDHVYVKPLKLMFPSLNFTQFFWSRPRYSFYLYSDFDSFKFLPT